MLLDKDDHARSIQAVARTKFLDNDLKPELLRIIEWDHQARYGNDVGTRHLATRTGEWMDPDVRAALHDWWGHLDAADSAAALRARCRSSPRFASRLAQHDRAEFDHARLPKEVDRTRRVGRPLKKG